MERMEVMEAALERLTGKHSHQKARAPTDHTLPLQQNKIYDSYMTCMGVVLINACIKRYDRGGLGTSVLGAIRPNCKFVTRHMSG